MVLGKLLIVSVMFMFLIGIGSSYYCVYQEDNNAVKEFKTKINTIALINDIESGMTEEAIRIKLNLFNPCKWQ